MKVLYTLLFCAMSIFMTAQDNFTYVTDFAFNSERDIYNFKFFPYQKMIANGGYEEDLEVGDVQVMLTNRHLYFVDYEGEYYYTVTGFDHTDYGYKLTILNSKNPKEMGHFKIILTPQKFVQAFVIKKELNATEVVYYQAEKSEEEVEAEEAYFTNGSTLEVADPVEHGLWGNEIRPYYIYTPTSKDRFYETDDVFFSFGVDTVEVIPGKKKDEIILDQWVDVSYVEKDANGNRFTTTEQLSLVKYKIEEDKKAFGKQTKYRLALTVKNEEGTEEQLVVYLSAQRGVNFIEFRSSRYIIRSFGAESN